MNVYGDMAFGNFIDSYKNLTLKTLSLVNWVKQSCKRPRYLLKVDDDIFINTKNMLSLINCLNFAENNLYRDPSPAYPNSGYEQLFVVSNDNGIGRESLSIDSLNGITFENFEKMCQHWDPFKLISYYISSETGKYESYIAAGYLYKHVSPDRNPQSKWYLPHHVYPSKSLPNFLSGTSYLLSTNLLTHLLTESMKTPLINLEDVYLTGFVGSNSLKLRLSHIDGWSNFRPRWNSACVYHELVTAHGLEAEELIDMSFALKGVNYEKDCQGIRKIETFLNNQISYYFPRIKV